MTEATMLLGERFPNVNRNLLSLKSNKGFSFTSGSFYFVRLLALTLKHNVTFPTPVHLRVQKQRDEGRASAGFTLLSRQNRH